MRRSFKEPPSEAAYNLIAAHAMKLQHQVDAWRECAKKLADALDYYHPALRDVEDGFSAERDAIAEFDRLMAEAEQ